MPFIFGIVVMGFSIAKQDQLSPKSGRINGTKVRNAREMKLQFGICGLPHKF